MKNLFIVLCIMFLLSSCFWSKDDTEDTQKNDKIEQETGDIQKNTNESFINGEGAMKENMDLPDISIIQDEDTQEIIIIENGDTSNTGGIAVFTSTGQVGTRDVDTTSLEAMKKNIEMYEKGEIDINQEGDIVFFSVDGKTDASEFEKYKDLQDIEPSELNKVFEQRSQNFGISIVETGRNPESLSTPEESKSSFK